VRYFVGENADSSDCLNIIESTVPCGGAILYTDEWSGYRRVEDELKIRHATVRHGRDDEGAREWARDDDGDGQREVHCNTCEGAGTGLRTYLRTFRGVHKRYLKL
jgi:transposase